MCFLFSGDLTCKNTPSVPNKQDEVSGPFLASVETDGEGELKRVADIFPSLALVTCSHLFNGL